MDFSKQSKKPRSKNLGTMALNPFITKQGVENIWRFESIHLS